MIMTRLDVFLVDAGYAESRSKAKTMIEAGEVFLDGKCCTKVSTQVETPSVEIRKTGPQFVGRGGYKLYGALKAFRVEVHGMTAVDIGASTGGFTQCLLMAGASRVYAVDAGRDQLHPTLRNDPRVVCMEGCNARELEEDMLGTRCDLCVMDVSFISQSLLYPAVTRVLREDGLFISLIKPQFEAGKARVGKGGLVRDLRTHCNVITGLISQAAENGLYCRSLIRSPIDGGDGNREYLALYSFSHRVQPIPDCHTVRMTVYGGSNI